MSLLQISVVLVVSNVHCSPVIVQNFEDEDEQLPHYYLGEYKVTTEKVSPLDTLRYDTFLETDRAAIINDSKLSPLRFLRIIMQMFINPFVGKSKIIGGSGPFSATGSAFNYFGSKMKNFFGDYLLMEKVKLKKVQL